MKRLSGLATILMPLWLSFLPCTHALAAPPAFEVLFDGKTLEGWKGLEPFWQVSDGCIVGQTTDDNPVAANTFLIYQGDDVSDFEFRCHVRFEGNNTGVQYRSELVDEVGLALKGYQADLHPKKDYFGMMYGEKTGRGIIITRGKRMVVDAAGKSTVTGKVGNDDTFTDSQWNELRIVAVGNRLIHQVNGVTTIDLTDDHPDACTSGKLGLQLHRGPSMKAEFRGLLLRPLEGAEAERTLKEAIDQSPPAAVNEKENASKPPAAGSAMISPKDLKSAPQANWVWGKPMSPNQQVWFRKNVNLRGRSKKALIYTTADNASELFINGNAIAKTPRWESPIEVECSEFLQPGNNEIVVRAKNEGGVAGWVMKMMVTDKTGKVRSVVSDAECQFSLQSTDRFANLNRGDESWDSVDVIRPLGAAPWNIPRSKMIVDKDTRDPLHPLNISVPPGFVIDQLYKIPKTQGSWVAMAVDPKGRIYACDQGNKGLYRITIGSSPEDTKVENVSVGPLEGLSAAQGLQWAFGSLWFHQNGGVLQRITDTDGDDILDQITELPGTVNGGEHGNHAVILTEDGKGLYLDGGNASKLHETIASRVPTWNEGLLLPRMWDANGHARGRMAPGGWVTQVDPESGDQTLHGIGFRNQYDIALNGNGDLFTYDADMEWDMGLPWYRPTRICHVTSGADYGWRSGSGKWPTYYEDSLPPVVEIGPGSPTGMVAGIGTRFPTQYQSALYALDWTFGTIYAIHLEPKGAGYSGTAEPFVYSAPLPVTDAVVSQTGDLVFAVGGRGTQSALFRVRYVGDASTAAPQAANDDATMARKQRRVLESFHGIVDPRAVDTAWPFMKSNDRFLRYAARIAVESQPPAEWQPRALSETDPQAAITSAVALARMGDSSLGDQIANHLLSLELGDLNRHQTLGWLRAQSLVMINGSQLTEATKANLVDKIHSQFPHRDADVNHEMIRVLVALQDVGVIAPTIELIKNRQSPVAPDWSTLASRNSRYGSRVKGMIDNPPPSREIGYAFLLRNMASGWTIDQRRDYFTFLNEAATASGGSSFAGYLTRIRDESLSTCDDTTRKQLEDVTGEDFNPKPDFPIAAIQGPGKKYDVASALAASRGKPDFESGRSLFVSGACASCHRLGGLGGNVGPDLTGLRNKFDETYLVEAIVHPSKNISDQYGSSNVLLYDGRVLSGLVHESADGKTLTVYSNVPDAKPEVVDADDVERVSESKVSQMPAELLDKMNAKEVRDLIGYLMAAGDPEDKRYRK